MFLIFDRLKIKITKHQNFFNSGIGVARIFHWRVPIRKSHTFDVIRNFQKEGLLLDKNILEWKIRSLGHRLVRKQDVTKRGGLELKVNIFKICIKFCCGGAVMELTCHRWGSWGGALSHRRLSAIFRKFFNF